MKRSLGLAFLLMVLAAFSANAVVIHWAVSDSSLTGDGVTSAQLVYVGEGTPTYVGGSLSNGTSLDTVGSTGITPVGIGEQDTNDGTTRSAGNYYIVLFDDNNQFRHSNYLAYNDTDHITDDPMFPDPSGGNFDPALSTFTTWAAVPEPGSAAMLAVCVGLLALRRRKRS